MLIEPLPDMFEKLVANYDNPQGLLRFECCAVGETDGETDIYRVDPKAIEQGLVEQWADGCTTFVPDKHLPQLKEYRIPVRIQTKTMKTLVEGWGRTPDFIQIDTEGYDFEIFMQCYNLGLTPAIYKIEIAHITYNTAVYIQHLLKNLGYKTFIDGYDLIAYRF
jgi:FkbM family methyltransferase